MFSLIKSLFVLSVVLALIFVLLFAYLLRSELFFAVNMKIEQIGREYAVPAIESAKGIYGSAKGSVVILWHRLQRAGRIMTGEE